MRVGIDARALTGKFTGDRTYWLNLIKSHIEAGEADKDANNEYVLFTRNPIPEGLIPRSPNCQQVVVPAPNDRYWTFISFPRSLREYKIDLAHTQYTTPIAAPCRLVTTVHDISFRLYPQWFPRKHRTLLNLSVPSSMRRADLVITDSFSSREDIIRIYRLPENKVAAIHLAAGKEYFPMDRFAAKGIVLAKYNIDTPYILSVSVLQPRKNLPLLLQSFAMAVNNSDIPHKLVLTGKKGWGYDNLLKMAAELNISRRLVLTDYVPDEDLPILYNAADIVAYPSLYEGFGLPPLEAMACGTPTIVSNAPCMPEISGNGALVLPTIDPEPWANAFIQVVSDLELRRKMAEGGLLRASEFDWVKTAAETRYHYEKVLNADRSIR